MREDIKTLDEKIEHLKQVQIELEKTESTLTKALARRLNAVRDIKVAEEGDKKATKNLKENPRLQEMKDEKTRLEKKGQQYPHVPAHVDDLTDWKSKISKANEEAVTAKEKYLEAINPYAKAIVEVIKLQHPGFDAKALEQEITTRLTDKLYNSYKPGVEEALIRFAFGARQAMTHGSFENPNEKKLWHDITHEIFGERLGQISIDARNNLTPSINALSNEIQVAEGKRFTQSDEPATAPKLDTARAEKRELDAKTLVSNAKTIVEGDGPLSKISDIFKSQSIEDKNFMAELKKALKTPDHPIIEKAKAVASVLSKLDELSEKLQVKLCNQGLIEQKGPNKAYEASPLAKSFTTQKDQAIPSPKA